jgi:hypothetical protein
MIAQIVAHGEVNGIIPQKVVFKLGYHSLSSPLRSGASRRLTEGGVMRHAGTIRLPSGARVTAVF